jgi:hypothetical protein
MTQPFPPTLNFHALNLKDLLEAREAYHVHLAHLDNVLATAVGLYRIRISEIERDGPEQAARLKPNASHAEPRTLANSQPVPGLSWPCVLVFVREWQAIEDFRHNADQVIPRRLYLPDGRMVPVCVVLAERTDETVAPAAPRAFPSTFFGGGYPALSDVQGQQHFGSIGCLVTDGRQVYALTNRHVTGPAGEQPYTLVRGKRIPLGVSAGTQVGKRPFREVFPGWPGPHSLCNLDAGLVRVEDLADWTAQVYGIGEIGEPVDLNTDTISLNLIGTPVCASGAASGKLTGEIHALFYRYKSIGGFDYIADLLIGPRTGQEALPTRHGDSGTMWFYDPPPATEPLESDRHETRQGAQARRLRPLALQWGGHLLMGQQGEEALQFVLASCVSTVCRVLDVELVRDLNVGLTETWGETGHFKIGDKALELPADPRLRGFLLKNRDRIARSDEQLAGGGMGRLARGEFVPLADVADLVWRNTRKADANNHFADMDRVAPSGPYADKDLQTLCAEDEANVDPHVWNQFYASLPKISPETQKPENPGALPFRVWQMYDEMVRSLSQGDVTRFLCVGGLMSHYVGDACQPLHISRLHHGNNPSQSKVHSDYETRMLDDKQVQPDLFAKVNKRLQGKQAKTDVEGGHAAAVSVVNLMQETIKRLPPQDVIESWAKNPGRTRLRKMWADLGDRTADCIAAGCLRLAALWQSAWVEGRGDKVADNKLVEIPEADLMRLYNNAQFVPSMSLQEMEERGVLRGGFGTAEEPAAGQPSKAKRGKAQRT